jgi:hypothetical protein
MESSWVEILGPVACYPASTREGETTQIRRLRSGPNFAPNSASIVECAFRSACPRELGIDLGVILKNPLLPDWKIISQEVRNGHECSQHGSASGSRVPATSFRHDGRFTCLRSHHGGLSSSRHCGRLLCLDKTGKTPRRHERQNVGLIPQQPNFFSSISDVESAPMIKSSGHERCPSSPTC